MGNFSDLSDRWGRRWQLSVWGTTSGSQTFTNLTVTGTLSVSGATTLSTTLAVTGATTLASTLGVTGATTLSAGISGTTATFSSTFNATGASTIGSTLSVTGLITATGGWTIPDDVYGVFGTDSDFKIGYDETTDNRLELTDGTNLMAYWTDVGTTGDFGVTGTLFGNTLRLHNGTTATLYNTTATTLNIGGAATSVTAGATTGTYTIRNATVALTGATAFTVTPPTSFSDAVTITKAAAGQLVVRRSNNFAGSVVASTEYHGINASSTYLAYGALQCQSDTLTAGAENGSFLFRVVKAGTLTLAMTIDYNNILTLTGAIVGIATQSVFNTVSTTLNLGGAATAINMGAGAASTLTCSFTTAIALNSAAWTTNQTTVAIANTTATTINFGAAASTALNIGHASGVAVFACRIRIPSVAASTTEGDVWSDSTQKTISTFTNGINQKLVGCLFTQTADKTIVSSSAETTLLTTGVGTLTLPVNFFVAGKAIRIRMSGIYGTTNPAGTFRLTIYYGGTLIADSGTFTLTNSMTTQGWTNWIDITCRTTGASGTVSTHGFAKMHVTGTSALLVDFDNLTGTPGTAVTVSTTGAAALDVKGTFSSSDAANTITCANVTIEAIN